MKVCCRVSGWRTAKKDSRRGLLKDCLSSLRARKSCVTVFYLQERTWQRFGYGASFMRVKYRKAMMEGRKVRAILEIQ